MPRRRRVRLENRLLALEAAVKTQPSAPPSAPVSDEQAAEVLTVLQTALGETGLGEWLRGRGLPDLVLTVGAEARPGEASFG